MNAGKFIDRNPDLTAAGKPHIIKENVTDTFKMFPQQDEMASYMWREECRKKLMAARKNSQPVLPHVPSNEVASLLAPELQKSRFVVFREKFSENMYFHKPELGKTLPALTKPEHITNENCTFGAQTKFHGDLYEIVFPKKSLEQVNREYIAFHEKKLISHRRYLPSERINRHYENPPYDPNYTFGIVKDVNKDGLKVKRCLEECASTVVISKVQKEYLERTQGALGKKIKSAIDIDENVPMGHPPKQDPCDVKSLLENIDPCVRNTKLLDAIIHLNKLRKHIFNRYDLHVNELMLALKEQDILNIGYLPLGAILKVTGEFYLHIDGEKIYTALKHFHMLRDQGTPTECVDYNAFCKILQIEFPLPTTGTITEMPNNVYNKDTTYRDLCRDRFNVPPEENVIVSPRTQRRNLIRSRIKIGDKTTAKFLISPDIPMSYGLEPRDFEIPRNKSDLQRIFQRLLCEEKFNEVWQRATELYEAPDHLFTVNEIRAVLGRSKPENLKSNDSCPKKKDLLPLNNNTVATPLPRREHKTETNNQEQEQEHEQQKANKEESIEPIDTQAGGDTKIHIANNDSAAIDVKS